MSVLFEKVTRAKSKARIAITGPSGAGKTLSALYLAFGLTGDWDRVALIDTEHERGRFYANREDFHTGAFLYAPMQPPYSPDKYIDYVRSAAQAVGEDGVIIVDSFSHAWDNDGAWKEDRDNEPEDKNDHCINAVQYGFIPYENKIGEIKNGADTKNDG